jgi:hypothetical protein
MEFPILIFSLIINSLILFRMVYLALELSLNVTFFHINMYFRDKFLFVDFENT